MDVLFKNQKKVCFEDSDKMCPAHNKTTQGDASKCSVGIHVQFKRRNN